VQSSRLRNLPDLLFVNRGDGTFERRDAASAAGPAGSTAGYGDAVVAFDYDRDGALDLFVTNGEGDGPELENGRNELLHNVGVHATGNHWLELDLVGVPPNRDAIGATVRLTAGGRLQVREQGNGMHRFAQDSARVHFGLGRAMVVESLLVRWPSGATTTLTGVKSDQVLRIEQPSH
jgi:hypothetical protein